VASVTINKRSIDRLVKKLDTLSNPTRKRDAEALGNTIVREMKKDIKRQKSPIRGHGSFPALDPKYKKRKRNAGAGDKADLSLTGQFLKSLRSQTKKVRDGFSTVINFSNRTAQLKEKGHREQANGQGFRPIIPDADEGFNIRISKIIEAFFTKRVRDIIRK